MSPSRLHPDLRHVAFAPLDGQSRAEAVERRLAEAIAFGLIAAGDQLPSEADLARQLGVATVTLREALAALRERGVVETRRGRGGGTFVRPQVDDPAVWLRAFSIDELRDLGDFAAAIAGQAAGLAAARRAEADLERLRTHIETLASARTALDCQLADRRFHVEIAACAHSIRLTREELSLQSQIGPLLGIVRLYDDGREAILGQHDGILDAIERQNPDRARELAERHVAHGTIRVLEHHIAVAGRTSRRRTADASEASATRVLARLDSTMDRVFASAEEIRDKLVALQEAAREDRRPLRRSDLRKLRSASERHLQRHPDLLAGIGVVCARDLLEDSPRWIEWWCATSGEPPRALQVNLDPDDPGYYDYERAEWFVRPRTTGQRSIAGPFVDYSGTDEHILTLTVPVLAEGVFLGVAGADIDLTRLEKILLPLLCTLPDEAAIINESGRVVVSNSARLPNGIRLSAGDRSSLIETGAGRTRSDGTVTTRAKQSAFRLVEFDSRPS